MVVREAAQRFKTRVSVSATLSVFVNNEQLSRLTVKVVECILIILASAIWLHSWIEAADLQLELSFGGIIKIQ